MKPLRIALLWLLAILVSACASGPKHAEVSSSIPLLRADQGRIYFYRSSSMLGAAIQPERGQTRYVRATVGMGLFVGRIYPELVDPSEGAQEVRESSYIGHPLGR